ncbi:MAG TPA: hypothetical protein VKY39_03380, partial [Aggregatilineales bacterium]|nr:hypothetical protein [Aggregatilineales bacterium]
MPESNKLGFVRYTQTAHPEAVEGALKGLRQLSQEQDRLLDVVEIDDLAEFDDAVLALLKQEAGVVATVGEASGLALEAIAAKYPRVHFVTVGYEPHDGQVRSIVRVPFAGPETTDPVGEMAARVEEAVRSWEGGWFQPIYERLTAWNLGALLVPLLSIITALIIGAVFIVAFDQDIWEAFGDGLGAGLSAAFRQIGRAYSALAEGAFGNPVRFVRGLSEYISTGEDAALLSAIYPLSESLRMSTPYIFTGLAVALGFRAGLFNIGAEGQYFIGGLTSTFIGYSLVGVPFLIHLPLAVLAGFAGGAAWAGIAGWLKAQTGAHEVITTIMLNYTAFRLADFMLQIGGPMARPNDQRPISPEVLPSAWLPQFFPGSVAIRINVGLILALLMVVAVWYLLFKTPLGFEFRTVGANPRAAKTAGIRVTRVYVAAMALSGGLAGLAGAHDILGVTRYMPNAFQSGYGFDAIALALLGRNHPVGVLLAALLFGFLRAGAQRMQAFAEGPIDIISILQGLIIIFIAAPEVIRAIYRVRAGDEGTETLTRGWGGA